MDCFGNYSLFVIGMHFEEKISFRPNYNDIKNKIIENKKLKIIINSLLIVGLLIAILSIAMAGSNQRYLVDYAWMIILAGLLIFITLYNDLKTKDSSLEIVCLCKKLEGNLFDKFKYILHMIVQMYHIATSKIIILDSLEELNELIKDIIRSPFSGIGKPEPLKHELSGYWSRRINEEHRLVYKITDNSLFIAWNV